MENFGIGSFETSEVVNTVAFAYACLASLGLEIPQEKFNFTTGYMAT